MFTKRNGKKIQKKSSSYLIKIVFFTNASISSVELLECDKSLNTYFKYISKLHIESVGLLESDDEIQDLSFIL